MGLAAGQAGGVRQERGAVLWIAVLLLLLVAIPALLQPSDFLQDDSYFYLQIARNIVAGQGSAFHDVTSTNGYHPLWMIGAVAATFLAGGDSAATLHVVVAIQVLIAAVTAWLFLRLARAMGLDYGLLGLAAVLSYLLGTGVYGSEAHLNALFQVASLWCLWRALGQNGWAPWFTTGLCFGFAILARLDNIFVAAALCAAGIVYAPAGGLVTIARRAAVTALGVGLLLGPYLVLNLVQYGHLVPISGAIKSTFPSFDFEWNRLGTMGKLVVPVGAMSLLVGQFLDQETRRRVVWQGMGAGVLAHALYVTGFTDHYTFWAWYYVSGVLLAGLLLSYLPGWVAARAGSAGIAVGIRLLAYTCMLAVLLGGAARAWLKAYNPVQIGPLTVDIPVNEYRWPEEFAPWLQTHLPPDSRIFVLDWPGALAYYSGLNILPMDGLMSDFRYNDEVLELGAHEYLCAHGVGYFFGLIEGDRSVQEVAVMAPLYRRRAGVLALRSEDIVVRVRDVVKHPDKALPFALWRLRCGGADRTGSRTALVAIDEHPPPGAARLGHYQ